MTTEPGKGFGSTGGRGTSLHRSKQQVMIHLPFSVFRRALSEHEHFSLSHANPYNAMNHHSLSQLHHSK